MWSTLNEKKIKLYLSLRVPYMNPEAKKYSLRISYVVPVDESKILLFFFVNVHDGVLKNNIIILFLYDLTRFEKLVEK